MMRSILVVAVLIFSFTASSRAQGRPAFDAFDVATIKKVDPDAKAGRFFRMDGPHRFIATNYTLHLLLAVAYDLPPRAISGGPAWMDSEHYDITAITPGEVRPTHTEQMTMLRKLLVDRLSLTTHREPKDFALYTLEIAKGGPKLKPSTAAPDDASNVVCTVYPEKVLLPARNVTMTEVTQMMQRALFDRPVVDKTGLSGRYDFDLQWAPDDTQFGGNLPPATAAAPDPPLFIAMEEQLGLKLTRTHGEIQALVVDRLERPTAN